MAQDWRNHQALAGRLHPDYPDDLQVIVHDGGPRFSDRQPELVWVRITGCHPDHFTGIVLNAPSQLESVAQNQQIRFVVPAGASAPILVSERYLSERAHWTIQPCQLCGLDELFDAPSQLVRLAFPDLDGDAQLEFFTTFCPLCGGVQGVRAKC
ncbi:MAG: hypothetical protein U0931_17935 [Vulcanimicrobiota bacterium]